MAMFVKDSLPTRASLLRRVKNVHDHGSWREFDAIYRKVIHAFAIKAGLTHEEAEDAVQDTFVKLAQKLPGFDYDPARGSFKNWLHRLAHAQVVEQFRRRPDAVPPAPHPAGEPTPTSSLRPIPDPSAPELERIWDEEWARYLTQAAEETVKRLVAPRHYQIYDLHVNKGWPTEKVAGVFSVPLDQVYLAKSRVTALMLEKIKILEAKGA